MKVISLKVAGRPQFPGILTGINSVISRNRVTVGAISATVCLLSVLVDFDPAMYAAAVTGMAAIRPFTGKGGEK